MENEGTAEPKPTINFQNPTKIHVIHLGGGAFRYIKSLVPFDTDMPRGMADKLCDANVRSDILVTPAVKNYLIKNLEIGATKETCHLHKRSIQRALLFLYNLE